MKHLLSSLVVAFALLAASPVAARSGTAALSEPTPGVQSEKLVKVCTRVLKRSKTLGVVCFVSKWGVGCTVEILKGLGYERLAKELLEIYRKGIEGAAERPL